MSGWVWGTVPEWIAAIGTGGAFLIAALAFAQGVGDRRKQQARLVHPFSLTPSGSPWIGGTTDLKVYEVGERVTVGGQPGIRGLEAGWITRSGPLHPDSQLSPVYEWLAAKRLFYCTAYVHNASDEVVTDVRLGLLILRKRYSTERPMGYVRPGEERIHQHWGVVPDHVKELTGHSVTPYAVFTDAAGLRWFKALDQSVRRVRKRASGTSPQHPREVDC